jgi:hypothetical protein
MQEIPCLIEPQTRGRNRDYEPKARVVSGTSNHLGQCAFERVAGVLIKILRSKRLVRDTKGGVGVRHGFYEAGENLSLICAIDAGGMSQAQIQAPPFHAPDEDISPVHH